jgi:hypothetical protein
MSAQLRTSEFFPVAYAELRKVAAAQLARLPVGPTLQPTALVHEAYLKLAGSTDSIRTFEREWRFARALLAEALASKERR